jgi:hypothetical protein
VGGKAGSGGGGWGGEMTQTLYAHMNKKTIYSKKERRVKEWKGNPISYVNYEKL